MSVKGANRDLERIALKVITSGKPSGLNLFSKLNEEHFFDDGNKQVFKRIKNIVKKRSEILSWDDLCDDTAIPQKTRVILKNFKKETKINPQRCEEIFVSLDRYRKIRTVFQGTKRLIEDKIVNADSIEIDDVIEELAGVVSSARSSAEDDDFYKIGKDDNVDEVVKGLLSRSGGLKCVPTGIKAWDEINRGFPLGSAVLIGAPTGEGKSLVADCITDNATEYGAKSCFVSLEMDIAEMMVRRTARYSKIDQTKILNPDKITDDERKKVYKAYKLRSKELARQGKTFYTKVPKGRPSIEELLMQLKPHDFDLIVIDYVSLLRGAEGEDQWRKLGDILAFCKTFARNNNCVVVMLVQITKELKLKYSSTLAEHADLIWFWTKDQAAIETGIYGVNVPKARKQKAFNFFVHINTDHATIKEAPKDYKAPAPKDIVNKELQKKKPNNDNYKVRSKIKDDDDLMDKFFGKTAGGKL